MLSFIILPALLLLRLDGADKFTPTSACVPLANGSVEKRAKSPLFLATGVCLEGPPTLTSRSKEDSSTIKPLSDDLLTELQSQNPNEHALMYDYHTQGHLQALRSLDKTNTNPPLGIQHDHFQTRSLDDLFPSLHFSETFDSSALFRKELRNAIRHDMVFDDGSPICSQMTNKQRYQELDKEAPMIGYWKREATAGRMKQTSVVLRQYLGFNAPTGDEFLNTIGALSNSKQAPFHWTEVVGVASTQNKKMSDKTEHAWHQDYGHLEQQDDDKSSYRNNFLVFLGFPCQNNYKGTGVFPHVVKLKHEQWGKSPNKPIFYRGTVPNEHVVRPRYAAGREIILFRDVDVLHSTPDIQYRTSIMRFG